MNVRPIQKSLICEMLPASASGRGGMEKATTTVKETKGKPQAGRRSGMLKGKLKQNANSRLTKHL